MSTTPAPVSMPAPNDKSCPTALGTAARCGLKRGHAGECKLRDPAPYWLGPAPSPRAVRP